MLPKFLVRLVHLDGEIESGDGEDTVMYPIVVSTSSETNIIISINGINDGTIHAQWRPKLYFFVDSMILHFTIQQYRQVSSGDSDPNMGMWISYNMLLLVLRSS